MRHEFFKRRCCSAQLILCLCLICIFISSVGLAQPYQSIFGEESSSWNVSMRSWMDSLTYIGDTVINGSEYKKVRRTTYDNRLAFLTEDTATGKVYYFTEDDPDQKLILDMSLSVGDSLFIASPYINEYRTVDSVYYNSGRKHIRFDALSTHALSQFEKLTFIEGIGSSFGLLYPEAGSLGIPILLCVWQDENQIYHDSLYDSCYAVQNWDFVNEKDDDLSSIKVYPNPVGHTLHVESKQHRIKSLNIYDLSGRLLLQHYIRNSQSGKEIHALNICDLPRGTYIIQAVTDKGSPAKKFIKDRD